MCFISINLCPLSKKNPEIKASNEEKWRKILQNIIHFFGIQFASSFFEGILSTGLNKHYILVSKGSSINC